MKEKATLPRGNCHHIHVFTPSTQPRTSHKEGLSYLPVKFREGKKEQNFKFTS